MRSLPDNVIVLKVRRPHRCPEQVLKVEADVGGDVVLTLVDGNGDPVFVHLTPREAQAHVHKVLDAIDIAKGIRRV